MSGGFFRGTSADQDTRFSNKQAKLLKTQKFAPELDHLVDMRKVKMDVMRPWIATRVTELIGIEDEVLINFIYGLLDGKEVNGKEIQISLTGFMEKNTVKFMKELWTLLLSAQNNESGVPQQFLDAKEEELRQKQAEMDRIANEIQKMKERETREVERQHSRKLDNGFEIKTNSAAEPDLKQKGSREHSEDGKDSDKRNGVSRRNRASPRVADRSLSSSRSRSASRSLGAQGRSASSDSLYRSPRKRSVSPRRRHSPRFSPSPVRRRSSYRQRSRTPSRYRSRSPLWRRSPSPKRRRLPSPKRRRLPSPARRYRSPSPVRRHRRSPSPVQHRRGSPSPVRRRRGSPSPVRRRASPSPVRRRASPSPVRRRQSPSPPHNRQSLSPVYHKSPVHHRSPSPMGHRSPPQRQISPSPWKRHGRSPSTPRRTPSPIPHRSPSRVRRRSPSPSHHSSPRIISSPSPTTDRTPLPDQRMFPEEHTRSSVQSPRGRTRSEGKLSSVTPRSSGNPSSFEGNLEDHKDTYNKLPALSSSPERLPTRTESPAIRRERNASEERRSPIPYESRIKHSEGSTRQYDGLSPSQAKHLKTRCDSPETRKEEETYPIREVGDYDSRSSRKGSILSAAGKQMDGQSPDKLVSHNLEARKDKEVKCGGDQLKKLNERQSVGKVDDGNGIDSGSEESGKHRSEKKAKRKHKRSYRHEVDSDDYSNDSEMEDKKEAKRRRKEEKKSRKEEKGRQREERRRRREERHAEKHGLSRHSDANSSENERKERKRSHANDGRREEHRHRREARYAEKYRLSHHSDANSSENESKERKRSHASDDKEIESDQKKLEIELRKKALESLKAKKGINH